MSATVLTPDAGTPRLAPPHPRILLFGAAAPADELAGPCDTVRLTDPAAVADALADGGFAAVVSDPAHLADVLNRYRRDSLILSFAERAFALLDTDGRIGWCNPRLTEWCDGDPTGTPLLAALHAPTVAADHPDPLALARSGRPAAFRLHRPGRPPEYLDVILHPMAGPVGAVAQVLALCRDVSDEVEQRKKFDALHNAGRELTGLRLTQLGESSRAERVEYLKENLRKSIHDLLHYDTIEIRLLDRRTQELTPLLDEGMTAEATRRRLYARPDGNGVTGSVAYHRRSHLCPDTSADPLYLVGASGARSSMTVPLLYDDELVGTFNVESPHLNAFTADDLQFTELFSREVAAALYTLDLLTAEQTDAAARSVKSVNEQIALPVDEVLASAAVLLKQLGDRDESVVSHLRRIVENARSVKASVRTVGQATDPAGAAKPLAGKRVLVIEQDAQSRRQAHSALEGLGAEVETVATAAEGLAVLCGAEYDAVFQELNPADLDGFDAYQSLRRTRPLVRVAITRGFEYDAKHIILKAKAAGLTHVVCKKPYRTDNVVAACTCPPPPPRSDATA